MNTAWWHRFSAPTGSSAGPYSAALSTSTSEPHRSPGQDRWPSSGTPHEPDRTIDVTARIKRRQVLHGLISEYSRAA